MSDATKITLTIGKLTYDAIESEAKSLGIDKLFLIREILDKHALASDHMSEASQNSLRTYRRLTEDVAQAARRIEEGLGFSSDITALAVAECQNDPNWIEAYAHYIGDDPMVKSNKRKTSLNQNIGYRVKMAVGAEVEVRNGKRHTRKIQDSVISSYSVLVKI